MPEPIDVPIASAGIRLGQFLKYAGLIDSGSEAKELLAQHQVRVNGQVDIRRGRQLVDGDVITLGSGPTTESARVVIGSA